MTFNDFEIGIYCIICGLLGFYLTPKSAFAFIIGFGAGHLIFAVINYFVGQKNAKKEKPEKIDYIKE